MAALLMFALASVIVSAAPKYNVLFIISDDLRAELGCYGSPRVVQAMDIYPTLAELCGLRLPKGLEGRSLVPLLQKPDARWNHPAFTVWSEDGRTLHGAAIRTERWRYAEFGFQGANGALLFDEETDPREAINLVEDPKLEKVKKELATRLQRYAAGYQPATK